MAIIRIIVGAAAIIAALSVALPASAQSCRQREEGCSDSSAGSPLSLMQFMTHRSDAAPAPAHRKTHKKQIAEKSAPKPAAEEPSPAAPDPDQLAAAAEPAAQADDASARPLETNGVAVAEPDQVNELDAQADTVQVVSADELNEIDLMAGPAPVAEKPSAKGLSSLASADQPAGPAGWIGKLLAALFATLSILAIGRLLLPRRLASGS